MIRNLLLDLGGVLYGIEYERTTAALGLGRDALPALLGDPILAAYEKGIISTEAFLSYWQERFPALSREQLIVAWNAMLLGILPESEMVLSSLSRTFQVALLSNTNELHLTRVEPEIRPWMRYFAGVFYSNRIQRRKPDPETYQFVLSQLGWKAEETLFVDDSLPNVKGAQSAGLHAQHFQPPNRPLRLLELLPTTETLL
ncbi:MAG: HAD family phosphatase [Bacteroidia bacterium]|nr:HAD family phosphatase [Bacteroidia bacterium]MCX7652014.1 HAD family phosphatase [Bacteroidia bacterium]MDW8416315.1 HAD family phosphatase [Bacteroidia bacterium]